MAFLGESVDNLPCTTLCHCRRHRERVSFVGHDFGVVVLLVIGLAKRGHTLLLRRPLPVGLQECHLLHPADNELLLRLHVLLEEVVVVETRRLGNHVPSMWKNIELLGIVNCGWEISSDRQCMLIIFHSKTCTMLILHCRQSHTFFIY